MRKEQEKGNRRMKALVVDDNKINLMVTKKSIVSIFDEVDEALSGEECLELVSKNDYDIILMDIMMPEMDGVETLKRLKENPEFKTPVLAVTADAEAGAEEKYMNEGFTEYIAKPFTPDQLRDIVNKYL